MPSLSTRAIASYRPLGFSHPALYPKRLARRSRPTALLGDREHPDADSDPPTMLASRRDILLRYVNEVQPQSMDLFLEKAHFSVLDAMRTTCSNMLGTLPPQFFNVTISSAAEHLAQLMFSVLMTGYLFRNAEYRMELQKSVGGGGGGGGVIASLASVDDDVAGLTDVVGAGSGVVEAVVEDASRPSLLPQSSMASSSSSSDGTDLVPAMLTLRQLERAGFAPGTQLSRVQGDVLLWHEEHGVQTLNAAQYIRMLEQEVKRLRGRAAVDKAARDASSGQGGWKSPTLGSVPSSSMALTTPSPNSPSASTSSSPPLSSSLLASSPPLGTQNELLEYLRTLDAASIQALTSSACDDVIEAMNHFVARLLGTRDREQLRSISSETSSSELGRLLLWLLVVGYSLRTMETRFDMENSMLDGGGR